MSRREPIVPDLDGPRPWAGDPGGHGLHIAVSPVPELDDVEGALSRIVALALPALDGEEAALRLRRSIEREQASHFCCAAAETLRLDGGDGLTAEIALSFGQGNYHLQCLFLGEETALLQLRDRLA